MNGASSVTNEFKYQPVVTSYGKFSIISRDQTFFIDFMKQKVHNT